MVVVVGALYVLFLMRRFPSSYGSVAQKLTHLSSRYTNKNVLEAEAVVSTWRTWLYTKR